MRTPRVDVGLIIRLYWNERKSLNEVGAIVGISGVAVRYHLRNSGAGTRPRKVIAREAAPQVSSHGIAGYDKGCRCEICVTARRDYRRDYETRRARNEPPRAKVYEVLAPEIAKLYQSGMAVIDIVGELRVSHKTVTRALAFAGVRKRTHRFERTGPTTPVFHLIAPAAAEMFHQDLTPRQIAKHLGVSPVTAHRALDYALEIGLL